MSELVLKHRSGFRICLPLLLIVSFLQLPAWNWSAAARAETLASYPAAGELPLIEQTGPILPALELTQAAGLQTGILPFIASGEFLTSPEVKAWNAANIALALSLFQAYNQHELAGPGAALAAGMIILIPLVSWVIMLGAFILAFGNAYAGGDWLVSGIVYLMAGIALLLPLGIFLLGISWLPPDSQTATFKTQLLSF